MQQLIFGRLNAHIIFGRLNVTSILGGGAFTLSIHKQGLINTK